MYVPCLGEICTLISSKPFTVLHAKWSTVYLQYKYTDLCSAGIKGRESITHNFTGFEQKVRGCTNLFLQHFSWSMVIVSMFRHVKLDPKFDKRPHFILIWLLNKIYACTSVPFPTKVRRFVLFQKELRLKENTCIMWNILSSPFGFDMYPVLPMGKVNRQLFMYSCLF